MKREESMADLFGQIDERMAKVKTKAERVRALVEQMHETACRDDLSEHSKINHFAYLGGMAATHLRAYAGHLERGEAE